MSRATKCELPPACLGYKSKDMTENHGSVTLPIQILYRSEPRGSSCAKAGLPGSSKSELKGIRMQNQRDERNNLASLASLYFAEFNAAVRTPRGLQLNLYRRGTTATSGAGKPPQKDVNATIRFPSALSLFTREIAEQWSIPGSSPISLRSSTSAFVALGREK